MPNGHCVAQHLQTNLCSLYTCSSEVGSSSCKARAISTKCGPVYQCDFGRGCNGDRSQSQRDHSITDKTRLSCSESFTKSEANTQTERLPALLLDESLHRLCHSSDASTFLTKHNSHVTRGRSSLLEDGLDARAHALVQGLQLRYPTTAYKLVIALGVQALFATAGMPDSTACSCWKSVPRQRRGAH